MKTPKEIKKGLMCCAPVNDDGVLAGDDGLCSDCPYNGTEHCGDKLKRDAFELINQLESALPKWISADKPPEHNKNANGSLIEYIVFIPFCGVKIGNYLGRFNSWFVNGIPVNVTHWMERPKPPKED